MGFTNIFFILDVEGTIVLQVGQVGFRGSGVGTFAYILMPLKVSFFLRLRIPCTSNLQFDRTSEENVRCGRLDGWFHPVPELVRSASGAAAKRS